MNIVIIEDEIKTAKALAKMILLIQPSAQIAATIQSVKTAVAYLSENANPDLIFMDVQLADGNCFEIFKQVQVLSPVIFCTAFDEYAMDAFKANGVDYILKPFSTESLQSAFEKVALLKNFFQVNEQASLQINKLLDPAGKTGFLVFKNNKYSTIQTHDIACFYIRDEITTLVTVNSEEYAISQSLEELYKVLNPKQFFRINRQYLISYSAVKEVEHYFARKLLVKLNISTAEQLIIGKDKATLFLNWLDNR
ncbi:LytR/AlgR family response regulator transcription factor [Pedobacter cryoconitis]|uniref:LytR/AlgR family response regulator transcription factor n=1 Tax=Pedobacter cryoconitis TaxID=188932 RepID=UPI00160FDF67|nr:LytTR family DNA-binding domain-containing protein [Pedobacter cryoconitis]MBB5645374.1 DNA-binding LytR/AlgR family response regulator [Pedobacter cryoconitis]